MLQYQAKLLTDKTDKIHKTITLLTRARTTVAFIKTATRDREISFMLQPHSKMITPGGVYQPTKEQGALFKVNPGIVGTRMWSA